MSVSTVKKSNACTKLNDATPSSFRFSCVRLGRTASSMSFSRKIASYFPRPRLRGQTTMSMTARQGQATPCLLVLKIVPFLTELPIFQIALQQKDPAPCTEKGPICEGIHHAGRGG